MLNIGVLISGGGTNLQALIDAEKRGEIPGGRLALVVASHRGAYGLQRAAAAGIPGFAVARKDFADAETYDAAMLALLKEHEIDLVVLAGFLPLVGLPLIQAYPRRIVNVHPSLIPSFCGKGYYGLHVHKAALARGVKVSGATVHLVDEVVDGGEILLQKAVEVCPSDTPETLQHRVMEQAEWVILPQAVAMLCAEDR